VSDSPDSLGLYAKYVVFKSSDLRDVTTQDQDPVWGDLFTDDLGITPIDDFVFVLRPDRDYHARVALAAYIESVWVDFPELAEDLRGALAVLPIPKRGAPD